MKTSTNEYYSKKLLLHLLEHLYEDDYFYHKKYNWEDWVIARADVLKIVNKCSDEDKAKIKMLDVDLSLFKFIYNSINGICA